MKAHTNSTKDPEREPGIRKKAVKPWRLEYIITDSSLIGDWPYKGKVINTWYEDAWEKFMSIEHGIKEINKMARTFNRDNNTIKEHWRFKGRELRLVNIESKETIPLVIGDREIYVKQD